MIDLIIWLATIAVIVVTIRHQLNNEEMDK